MPEALRYYVGCTGKARGGWFVASVHMLDGKETAIKVSKDLSTKAEAKRLAGLLNEELKGQQA